MSSYLEFQKLCLEIQMTEFENYFNDPATQFSLEYAKLTNPKVYEETMQKYRDIKERYDLLMTLC